MEKTKCLIIGSGPAGYTAAIYASRANLSPIEYSGMQPGGQLTQTTEVENFPGYPQGVDGNQMMMDLREQAERFGTDIRDGEIVKVDFTKSPYICTAEDGTEIVADTVIIATGASAKYLGLDDERKYNGQGVSACATCDGFFYRKKTVAVVVVVTQHVKMRSICLDSPRRSISLSASPSFVHLRLCSNAYVKQKISRFFSSTTPLVYMVRTVLKAPTSSSVRANLMKSWSI